VFAVRSNRKTARCSFYRSLRIHVRQLGRDACLPIWPKGTILRFTGGFSSGSRTPQYRPAAEA
jgi:hypothetical protein